MTPSSVDEFLALLRKSRLVDDTCLAPYLARPRGTARPQTVHDFADELVRRGVLTHYQAVQLLQGKWDHFAIGPFKILERLGFGAVSNVYLCERPVTHGRVAVKVLTKLLAADPTMVQRFYREARAAGLLDHPNIVRAHDVDQAGQEHFMVMDFVDGSSIQDIVQHSGPMDVVRSAHYIRQAALGLQYAHEKSLVHRDIKPGNLLIDRQGQVKILDMGLARFEEEGGMLTQGGVVLGAPEYLAPEQAIDSHNVDTRADVYGLGGTFYFMLTGQPPYAEEKTLARKLLAKQERDPRPIAMFRADVPQELVAVIERMMARDPKRRFPTPGAVAEALAPWTATPIPPPPEKEMPQLSAAALAPVHPAPAPASASAEAPPKVPPEHITAPATHHPAAALTRHAPPEDRSIVPPPAGDESTAVEAHPSQPGLATAAKPARSRHKKRSRARTRRSPFSFWSIVLVIALLVSALAFLAVRWEAIIGRK